MRVLEAGEVIRYARWAGLSTRKCSAESEVVEADRQRVGALGATTYLLSTSSCGTVDTDCTGAIRPVVTDTGERAGRITYWSARS